MKKIIFCLWAAGLLAGCGPAHRSGAAPVELTGAGSSFVYPLLSRWAADFHAQHPEVTINYQSIGSGAGIEQVKNGTVDFGASDAALSDAQLAGMPAVVQLAESAGPVCITYNLPVTQPLRLTGAALAGIYLGAITRWNDARIAQANPGVALPNLPIQVVHRSDGSGTTAIFTTFLAAADPGWKAKVGSGLAVAWPVGLGGKGSAGVTAGVQQTPGAIGYVELTYASGNHLPVAAIENPEGEYVTPSTASAAAAIAAGTAALARDVRAPIVNMKAAGAYPITGLTFLILPKTALQGSKAAALRAFVEYVLNAGQVAAAGLNYAPLPPALAAEGGRRLGASGN